MEMISSVGVAEISPGLHPGEHRFKSDTEYKYCSRCGESKRVSEFALRNRNGKQSWQAYCRKCNKTHKNEWLTTNREKVKWNRLWSVYRLRREDWEALFNKQDGKCEICQEVPPEVVDHDHQCCNGERTCGKCVRGLLCVRCNVYVGRHERNPGLYQRIIEYSNKEINGYL